MFHIYFKGVQIFYFRPQNGPLWIQCSGGRKECFICKYFQFLYLKLALKYLFLKYEGDNFLQSPISQNNLVQFILHLHGTLLSFAVVKPMWILLFCPSQPYNKNFKAAFLLKEKSIGRCVFTIYASYIVDLALLKVGRWLCDRVLVKKKN